MTSQIDSLIGFLILSAACLLALFIKALVDLGNTFTRRQP